MITFSDICNDLTNWNSLTNGSSTRASSNSIMGPLIEFDLSSIPALDSSSEPVNVYVGYNNTYLVLVMIQKSKDIQSRYTTDLPGVLSDMAIVQANYRTGSIVNVPHSTLLTNQITNAEAIARTAAYASATNRLNIMNDLNYGPIFFEVPKSNFLLSGNKKAIFGIKTEKIKKADVTRFDLIIENWENGQEANKMYFDVSLSIPPHKASGNYGLYQYLNYNFS